MNLELKSSAQLNIDFKQWLNKVSADEFLTSREDSRDFLLPKTSLPEIYLGTTKFNYLSSFHCIDYKILDDIFVLTYQSNDRIEFVNGEQLYPLLNIGILSHITAKGRHKRSIIKNGQYRTILE